MLTADQFMCILLGSITIGILVVGGLYSIIYDKKWKRKQRKRKLGIGGKQLKGV